MTVRVSANLPVGEQRQLAVDNLVRAMRHAKEYAAQVINQDFAVEPHAMAELDVITRDLVEAVCTLQIASLGE